MIQLKKFINPAGKKLAMLLVCAAMFAAAAIALADKGDVPLPHAGYPPRGESMTGTWDKEGLGYVDPDVYEPPSAPDANGKSDCVSCHQKISPRAVSDFQGSKMAKSGLTCDSCHGMHPDIKMPNAEVCGKCHSEKYDQFEAGKHGRYGWKGHAKGGRRLAQYSEMQEAGCGSCHNVGKKCDSCHTRHSFDPAEARRPEACSTCHMGPDHGQIEYYEASKHGVIYTIEGKSFEEGGRAPVCITCHMPKGNHDVSQGLTIGSASQGKWVGDKNSGDAYVKDPNGITMNEITPEDFKRERAKMAAICSQCHSPGFAEHKLATADGIKLASDEIAGQALATVLGLYKDGLLDPMPKDRPANPFPDATGNQADGAFWLTGHQLYEQTSGIEAKFFEMYKFDLVHAWKGAYHFSPDWTHWYGNAPMKLKLSQINTDANMIRRVHALEQKAGITPPEVQAPINDNAPGK